MPFLPPNAMTPEEEAHFQETANQTAAIIYKLMHTLHAAANQTGDLDAANGAPVIQGALGGVIQFVMDSDATDEDIRAIFMDAMENMLPQFHMAKASRGMEGGHA